MGKHTPGAWNHLGGSYAGRVVDGNREVVALVNGVSRGGRGRLGSPVANANARLIAASPELLEGLQQAVTQLERDYKHTPLDGRGALIRKLRALIKKAGAA